MKTQKTKTPEQARKLNGGQLLELAQSFGLTAIKQDGCSCKNCATASADSHFFAVALGIIGAAAIEDRAAVLYEVLTKFAAEHLEEFPASLRGSLYADEVEFPEIIHEAEASDENYGM